MTIHIKPGEFYLGPYVDEEIVTVLGSCISVVMWHTEKEHCAMSHFVILNTINEADKAIGRYGQRILPHFVRYFDRLKCPHEEINVSVFGGAVSFQASNLNTTFQMGRKNSEYALNFLDQEGFAIESIDVGGTRGRKLIYTPMMAQCDLQLLPSLTD
ncbi:MAG: chemotaxis protein CheD [Gammaproteobacteria bacterium]|nr:chemotaxis protein CheD [Gammaproteobacteria bacterium]